jgi:hypothetical protein
MKGRHTRARRALCVCINQPRIKDDPIKDEAIIPIGVFTLSRERKVESSAMSQDRPSTKRERKGDTARVEER